MKKLIIIALLILSIIGISTTVCLAEESTPMPTIPSINTNDEYNTYPVAVVNGSISESNPASTKNSLPLYTSINDDSTLACYVPPTYYVHHIQPSSEDLNWQIVMYNNTFFYVKKADLEAKTTDIVDMVFEEGVSPAFQASIQIKEQGEGAFKGIAIYLDKTFAEDKIKPVLSSEVVSTKFIGLSMYNTESSSELCYFVNVKSKTGDLFGYVLPNSTNNSTLSFVSIANHPYYQEPTTEDGEVVPEIKPTEPGNNQATSNLVRNILIGVICILCVSIVLIVFKPQPKN